MVRIAKTEDMEKDPWGREVDGTNTIPPISCFVFGDSAESGWPLQLVQPASDFHTSHTVKINGGL